MRVQVARRGPVARAPRLLPGVALVLGTLLSAAGAEESASASAALPPEAGQEAGTEPAARATVEGLHDALLEAMKRADELGFEGRRKALAPVLDRSFDFPFMSRLALGFGWRNLDEAQRERWVQTFRDFSLATYAARFNAHSGEHFETEGTESAAHDTVLVKTRLVLVDEDPVSLHYRLRKNDDAWRVIDIYMNGTVSEIALRRSEFSSVLDRDGFDALLAEIEEKIAAYEAGETSSSV